MSSIRCTAADGRCSGRFFEDRLAEQLGALLAARKSSSRVGTSFDFSDLYWADLLEFLAIVALAAVLDDIGGPASKIVLPPTSERRPVTSHLSGAGFMSLASTLDLTVEGGDADAVDPYAFFRFTQVSTFEQKEEARRLVNKNLATKYRWISGEQCLSFDRIINEALENCLDHAYPRSSPNAPRLVAVRQYPGSFFAGDDFRTQRRLAQQSPWLSSLVRHNRGVDYLEICIVDVGLGIGTTIGPMLRSWVNERLQATHQSRSPLPGEVGTLAALRFVLSPNKSTSIEGGSRRGQGLYKLKNHVQAWDGLLQIRSNDVSIVHTPTSTTPIEHRVKKFPGTQIRVLLPMADRSKSVRYILAREAEL